MMVDSVGDRIKYAIKGITEVVEELAKEMEDYTNDFNELEFDICENKCKYSHEVESDEAVAVLTKNHCDNCPIQIFRNNLNVLVEDLKESIKESEEK